jgi:MFS family permease
MGNLRAPWQLPIAALLTGAGGAMCGNAAATAMVAVWFDQRRPAANALALNGYSCGGLVFVSVWVALIDTFGLKVAAMVAATAVVGVLWPLAGSTLRATPDALGLMPDGDGLPRRRTSAAD